MSLQINRGLVVDFEALPLKSIALDGYVQGPQVDVANERFSFDHHDRCVRLVTRATCQQVMDALLLGFDPAADYTIYLNDVDGDTTLAVWLLRNPSRVSEDFVRHLTETVGAVDAHGPAYPVIDRQLADTFYQRVMQPVTDLRRAKKFGDANLEALLASCLENIDRLTSGRLDWTPAPKDEDNFVLTHAGTGWVMVKSDYPIFETLYKQGYNRVVAYQVLPDRSIAYTVAKKSELVSGFPVGPQSKAGTILHALNEREPGWGGSSTIGGAPRNADGSRSRLTPDEVFGLIGTVLDRQTPPIVEVTK